MLVYWMQQRQFKLFYEYIPPFMSRTEIFCNSFYLQRTIQRVPCITAHFNGFFQKMRTSPWPRYPGTSPGPSSNYFIASPPTLHAVTERTSLIEEPGHKLHTLLSHLLHCSLDSSRAMADRPCFIPAQIEKYCFNSQVVPHQHILLNCTQGELKERQLCWRLCCT